MRFVRDGFICGDMEGAKRAFLAALDIAKGADGAYDDNATRKRIDEEIDYIWCDDYTDAALLKIGIDKSRKQELLRDFITQQLAKGQTHPSLQLARRHFLNWVNVMKDKHGTDNHTSVSQWQGDIVERIARLAR